MASPREIVDAANVAFRERVRSGVVPPSGTIVVDGQPMEYWLPPGARLHKQGVQSPWLKKAS